MVRILIHLALIFLRLMPLVILYSALYRDPCHQTLKKAGFTEKDITAAEDSLTAKGWEGSCYGRSVRTAAAELLALARKPLNGEERAYLEAFESVIEFQGIANVKN